MDEEGAGARECGCGCGVGGVRLVTMATAAMSPGILDCPLHWLTGFENIEREEAGSQ